MKLIIQSQCEKISGQTGVHDRLHAVHTVKTERTQIKICQIRKEKSTAFGGGARPSVEENAT